MNIYASQRQEAELRRLARIKQGGPRPAEALGPDLVGFFKHSVQKRQSRLLAIAERWQKLVPALLVEHSSLESFNRGVLTVLVDSSSHLYDLKQLLLAGLEAQILLACRRTGLRRITLKAGRWYQQTPEGDRSLRF